MNKSPIGLLMVIVAVLIVSGCTQLSELNTPFSRQEECQQLALALLPENITMFSTLDQWRFMNDDNHWKDGSKLSVPANFLYEKGSSEGQNINYYYFGIMGFSEQKAITYSKKIIAENGDILGIRSFTMTPVLDAIEGTEKTDFALEKMEFKIVTPNFVSCHWVTDDGKVIE